MTAATMSEAVIGLTVSESAKTRRSSMHDKVSVAMTAMAYRRWRVARSETHDSHRAGRPIALADSAAMLPSNNELDLIVSSRYESHHTSIMAFRIKTRATGMVIKSDVEAL